MPFPGDLLYERLLAQSHTFHKVVDFNPSKEKLIKLDFTDENTELLNVDINFIIELIIESHHLFI